MPIEKGANEGQQTYGNDLVKALRATISKPRGAIMDSKAARAGKKKKRAGEATDMPVTTVEHQTKEENWGMLELLRGLLGPVVDTFKPFATGPAAVVILFLLFMLWLRSPTSTAVGYSGFNGAQRMAAYEEMWRREEGELWDWLEHRVGIEGLVLGNANRDRTLNQRNSNADAKKASRQRQKLLVGNNIEARLREEKMVEREMEDAIRITQERLRVLTELMEKRKENKRGEQGDHGQES